MDDSTTARALPLRPFALGEWQVDPRANCLRIDDRKRQLEPKTMAVLLTLANASGAILTKSELIDGVWPHRYVVEGVLKRAISQLRKALDDDARTPRYVQTIYKVGYRLLQPARRLPSASRAGIDVSTGRRIVTGTCEDITRVLDSLDAGTASRARLTLVIGQ